MGRVTFSRDVFASGVWSSAIQPVNFNKLSLNSCLRVYKTYISKFVLLNDNGTNFSDKAFVFDQLSRNNSSNRFFC